MYNKITGWRMEGVLKITHVAYAPRWGCYLLCATLTLVSPPPGLASYPIDTIRRRMMMTSGQAVKYRSSMHCASEIMKNEGIPSMFKGAGANILRAVAGAGVLSGYDALQVIVFGKKFGSGE